MAAKTYKLPGTFHWAKVFESNRDEEGYKGQAKEFGGEYSVTVVFDADAVAIHKKSGSQKKVYSDPEKYDGQPHVKYTRKHESKVKGEVVSAWSGAPLIYDADGGAWPEDELLGNGTEGVVKFTVYDAGENKGTRLDALQVTKHVEFGGTPSNEDYVHDADEVAF